MPKAAPSIRRSFTAWDARTRASAENKPPSQAPFESGGEAAEVPLEAHIDDCGGMTGSGAAFPALLAQGMIAHAVAQGLPSAFAKRAAKGVVARKCVVTGHASHREAGNAAVSRRLPTCC